MKKLFSIFSLVLLYVTMAYGQAPIDIPVTIQDNAPSPSSQALNFGLDLTATNGIDPLLDESDLPPPPPAGVFDARWTLNHLGVGNLSTWKDYRNAPAFPFTGTVEHRLQWQLSTGASQISVNYNLLLQATIQIQDLITGTIVNSGVLTGTGAYVISTPGILAAKMTVNYTNIGPASPGPIFSMSPPSLNFGTVGVGGSSTLPVTVQNPGTTNALDITAAVSTNPVFTF